MLKTESNNSVSIGQLKLKHLPSGLLLVKFDSPQKANHLTSAVMAEFEEVLNKIEQDASIKAVGLMSAKPDSFLLGADLREIMQLKSEKAALELVTKGQQIFARFASLRKPTIAGIHGICLGGGLELALCCHKRLATNSKLTALGLPETRLGFVPGLGGTQRLPRLIGLKSALDLILSAEPIDANKALEIGLIDQIVDEADLEREIEKAAKELLADSSCRAVDERYSSYSSVDDKKDEMSLKTAKRSMRILTRGNYPAQVLVIDVVEFGLKSSLPEGLAEEAKVFAKLSVSEISRNLVFLFFNTELLRQSALNAAEKENVPVIRNVGVIGGGMMGASLAGFIAEKGYKVLFRSASNERSKQVFETIKEEREKSLGRKLMANQSADTQMDKPIDISLVTDDIQFADADIILEAIEEKFESKLQLFNHLENLVKPDCILASITSSLSVTKMASETKPSLPLLGAHFFHPVDKMPLVEIVMPENNYIVDKGLEQNYRQANAKLLQFIAELGKTPLLVKDNPCFLVNRLIATYLLEAARLAEAGVPLNWIDKAAVDFGMPIGPLTLLDEIGFDIALLVAGTLADKYKERIVLPAVLRQAASIGMKGKRAGLGVYEWDSNGKRLGINRKLIEEINLNEASGSADDHEGQRIAAALILPMIDEAARCMHEKIVRRAREVDIASVLGLGFPPFRGGILKYADSVGLSNVLEQLETIYAQSKPVRQVSSLLSELAQKDGKFYT